MQNIFGDWRVWLFVVSLVKDFALVIGVILIKFNDMKHMGTDMVSLQKGQEEIKKGIQEIGKSVIAIETRCQERHPKK